jgi:hypothetical protein
VEVKKLVKLLSENAEIISIHKYARQLEAAELTRREGKLELLF